MAVNEIVDKEELKNKDPEIISKLEVKLDKMSKSKKNGVDPDEIIQQYGADTVRLFMLFAAPPERDLEWNDAAVEGSYRFLRRTYISFMENLDKILSVSETGLDKETLSTQAKNLRIVLHKTIKQVTGDFVDRYHFNTGIARIMELVNAITAFKPEAESDYIILRECYINLAKMLNPVAPHLAQEIYSYIFKDKMVIDASWPSYNETLTIDDTLEIVFQVNGKLRSRANVKADISKEELERLALSDVKIKEYIEGKTPIKVIVVPKKLVNIVVK